MPVTAGAFLTSVCINGSIGFSAFGLFAVLRSWRLTAPLYKPKRYLGADNPARRKPKPLARELPAGLLSWIGPVWRYPEAEVIDLCGLDVAVFFRVLQLGFRLFCFISAWCLLVVLPVNLTGGYLERHKRGQPGADALGLAQRALLTPAAGPGPAAAPANASAGGDALASLSRSGGGWSGGGSGEAVPWLAAELGSLAANFTDAIHTNLDLLTLSNVAPGSPRMWIHLVSVYVITIVTLKLLWNLSRDVSQKRALFLALQGASGRGSSVLVTDLPGLEWGTPLHRMQLSWLTWLLPGALVKRGYESFVRDQAWEAQRQRRLASRSPSAAGSRSQLQQPLLEVSESEAGPGEQGQPAPGAAAPGEGGGDSSSLPSLAPAGSEAPGEAAGVACPEGRQLACPLVQDVWAEAVTVLATNGGDVKAMVQAEVERVYGQDSVAAIVLLHNTSALEAAAGAYCKLQEAFEDVLDWYECRLPPRQQQQQAQLQGAADVEAAGSPGASPGAVQLRQVSSLQHQWLQAKGSWHKLTRKTVLVLGPSYGAWGVERYGTLPCQVDALDFYPAVLQHQLGELQKLQAAARAQLPRPAAVVTFRQQLVATLAATSFHCYDESAWVFKPAPAPQELLWRAIGLRSWEVTVRQLAVWGAFWLLVLFYAPIVAAIQAPVNIDTLRKVPFIAQLLDYRLVSSLVQGFLPSLVLLIFLAVLPDLLLAIISRGGLASSTEVDAQLTQLYFLFQLFALFIFSFISGTALSQLQRLLDDPHRIISLLGIAAPQQASFFSTYILLLGLSRTPLQLLRLPVLAWFLLRIKLVDSPRQKRRLWADQQQLLGRTLPLHTLVLLLGLVFCVASPLIAPVTLLYFVSASVCQRYQWLYVYRHPYEGAGTLWRAVFTQVLVAVYFFVAVMACLLGIKRFEQALLLLPLAAGVLAFHVLASRLLERPLTLPSTRAVAAADQAFEQQARQQQQQQQPQQQGQQQQQGPASRPGSSGGGGSKRDVAALAGLPDHLPGGDTEELDALYLAPAMKLSPAGLQALLDEAQGVRSRLAEAGL